ncbi:SDR family oxidoreductase [Sorangium sp. So ce1335]|uniref:SDR family oxidoreductase n=1 Tax=Sorangium sp. So ce1335 TaxID=3133335 RepID=UPI003F60C042
MSRTLPLAGRIAVVTGASSGIGEATARKLAAEGAAVALLARRKDRLESLAQGIRAAGGRALALSVDATSGTAVAEAARIIAAELGTVDLVINNAGVMLPSGVEEHRVADFEQMISVNLTGAMRIVDAFVDPLVAAAKKGGPSDLINVSSVAAHGVFPTFAVYCATKAAVTHLSRNLRAELGPKNVRVSVVEPGFVDTELQGHMTDEAAKAWIARARQEITWLTADDLASTIAFTVGLPRHVNLAHVTVMPTQQV